MAEGKLTVGVEIDAGKAFAGFADSVMAQMRPQLDKIQRDMQNQLGGSGGGGGGGGGGGFAGLGSIAAGSFVGAFGSQLAMKGIAVFESFARAAKDAVMSIMSGGWDRLVAIDTAKTKMLALKVSAGDTAIVMQNALAAVKGTAFGLGDAATVAATALAAGVKPGKSLTDYLRLTADTAAVAAKSGADLGATFNEVGYVLNKVTTQGYATNQELQMLSDKGLPIYQNLAKNLDLSAGAVIQLAEKSGVAASAVRKALIDTVGGAALIMGQSFEGAMNNAEAAFDRLGEALLKPFFQPVKDGVGDVSVEIDQLTDMVTQAAPQIVKVVGGIAIAFIDMSEWAIKSVGNLAGWLGDIIAPLGDAYGILLKYQALFEPDPEVAAQLRAEAEEAFGLGEGLNALRDAANSIDSDPLKAKVNALTDSLARGAKVTAEYSNSQKALAEAVKAGNGEMVYQAQLLEWQNKVREALSRGQNGWSIPAPNKVTATGGGDGGMPADVAKTSGSGGSGSDKTPWLAPGAPIPTYEELLAAGGGAGADVAADAVAKLPPAAADLTGAAKDLSDAAAAQAAAATIMPGFGGGGSTSRLVDGLPGVISQPSTQAAAAAVIGLFGDQIRGNIGGSGARPKAPGTHDVGLAMDIPIGPDQKPLGDAIQAYLQANAKAMNIRYTIWRDQLINTMGGSPQTVGGHQDHIDVQFFDGTTGAGMPAIPNMPSIPGYGSPSTTGGGGGLSPGQSYGEPITVPGLGTVLPIIETDYSKLGLAPGTYQIQGGITAPDPAAIAKQESMIAGLNRDLIIKEARIRDMKASAAQAEKLSAANEYQELQDKIKAEKDKLDKLKRGETGSPQSITVGKPSATDYSSLPFGHPARILAGAIGGMGGTPEDIAALVGPVMGSFGGPLGGAAGQVAGAAFGIPLPGPMGYPGTPTAPATDLNKLVQQQNPFALAQAAGFDVPDYSRAGGGPSAQDLNIQGGAPTDAMGRMYSDTAALIDRTFTNMDAADKARHDQTMTVLNEVRDRLAGDFVGPVTEKAVSDGINGMGDGAAQAIGAAMGQTAGPIIAAAIPSGGGGGGEGAAVVNTGVNAVTGAAAAVGGFAVGGPIIGPGTATSDSILARLSHGEYVLPASDVARMGGFASVDRFRSSLWGRVPRFATGGGVDVSSSVGAEFFGVGQVPIISAIVNLLIAVLLKIIGVTVEARDTLNEISSDFREYRGDFKAFDAAGRMMNDTSGLVDRTGSSEQAAADERIRILKMVLEGLFKFIVEKIIVPIAKAAGNALLQAASSAMSGAASGAFPGGGIVGGAVGGIITSAGSAGIDIAAEIGTILAESIFSVGLDAAGGLMQSLVPGITNALFGGGLLSMIVDPITSVFNGMFSGIATLFGGLFGGMSTLIPGLPFDEGGLAIGTGLMPKATIQPERVLSPRQTESFDRLVSALERGPRSGSLTTIHAPFTVAGGERGGREARDRLLALMS